jgi:hypothetical protein
MMADACVDAAYVIGAICGVVSMRDPATQDFQQSMDLLNQYMVRQLKVRRLAL